MEQIGKDRVVIQWRIAIIEVALCWVFSIDSLTYYWRNLVNSKANECALYRWDDRTDLQSWKHAAKATNRLKPGRCLTPIVRSSLQHPHGIKFASSLSGIDRITSRTNWMFHQHTVKSDFNNGNPVGSLRSGLHHFAVKKQKLSVLAVGIFFQLVAL